MIAEVQKKKKGEKRKTNAILLDLSLSKMLKTLLKNARSLEKKETLKNKNHKHDLEFENADFGAVIRKTGCILIFSSIIFSFFLSRGLFFFPPRWLAYTCNHRTWQSVGFEGYYCALSLSLSLS